MSQAILVADGSMTDEIVHAFCRQFKEISSKRKLREANIPVSDWSRKYGVDVLFGKGVNHGLIRVRFITKDDIDIKFDGINLRKIAMNPELIQDYRNDTIEAIKQKRRERALEAPYVIKQNPVKKIVNALTEGMKDAIDAAKEKGKTVVFGSEKLQ